MVMEVSKVLLRNFRRIDRQPDFPIIRELIIHTHHRTLLSHPTNLLQSPRRCPYENCRSFAFSSFNSIVAVGRDGYGGVRRDCDRSEKEFLQWREEALLAFWWAGGPDSLEHKGLLFVFGVECSRKAKFFEDWEVGQRWYHILSRRRVGYKRRLSMNGVYLPVEYRLSNNA